MSRHDDERLIACLLQDAAQSVPSDVDLTPRLRPRLAQTQEETKGTMFATRQMSSKAHRSVPIIAIALVAILAISAFAFARPLISSWLGDTGMKGLVLGNGSLINQSVTVNGITLRLEQGYADAARTALTMQISSTGSDAQSLVTPMLDQTHLVDSQGRIYTALVGTQVQNDGLMEFTPLPSSALSTQQSFTLVVTQMNRPSSTELIPGNWQITFKLHPHAIRSIEYNLPSAIIDGVSVQPERLDVTPAGARLFVKISGLKPSTSLFGLTNFAQTGGDSITGCNPDSRSCVGASSTSGGATLNLQEPDGQRLELSAVEVVDMATGVGSMPTADQIVGPSGSVVLEFLFWEPFHRTQGTAHLTINQIRLSSGIGSSSQDQMLNGPWAFDLALQ